MRSCGLPEISDSWRQSPELATETTQPLRGQIIERGSVVEVWCLRVPGPEPSVGYG